MPLVTGQGTTSFRSHTVQSAMAVQYPGNAAAHLLALEPGAVQITVKLRGPSLPGKPKPANVGPDVSVLLKVGANRPVTIGSNNPPRLTLVNELA